MIKNKRIKPFFGRGRTINSGHPIYVFNKYKKEYEFIGLTHSPITRGIKNIKLDKNPNPKDFKDSYLRPFKDRSNEKINTKYSSWKFCETDKSKVKSVIKQNKKS